MKILMFDVLLLATAFILVGSYLAYRKRRQVAAKYYILLMLAASFYSLGYAFEIMSANLEQAKFWMKVQYIAS